MPPCPEKSRARSERVLLWSSTAIRGWMTPWPDSTSLRWASTTQRFSGCSMAPIRGRMLPGVGRESASSVRMKRHFRSASVSPTGQISSLFSPQSRAARDISAPRLRSQPS